MASSSAVEDAVPPNSICPSLSSTPFRPAFDPRMFEDSPHSDKRKNALNSSLSDKTHSTRALSLRHSLGHSSIRGLTAKRALWTSQRTCRLFELLTRPALLFSPSLGIRLPFDSPESQNRLARVLLPLRKRNQPVDPDPCLLSIDGLLDCLYATTNLVEQVYADYKDNDENQPSGDGCDEDDSPTLTTASYFLKRVKPAMSRLMDLRVKLSDFKLGNFIGRGACGVVRVVHEVAPPCSVYAMKSQYKRTSLRYDPEGAQLMLERTVLAQATAIENPWLPHLHYAFQDDKNLHLVMDYESGGDLYIFLRKVGHLLDADMIAFYAAEAVEAVHSLHKMGYIHCDIKPENFAIERSGHLKLLDFGSAMRLDSDGKCICPTMVGTKEYLNIELMRQRGRHHEQPLLVGPEYDYWALGVLLYEMFYGETPFYDDNEDTMMQNIVDYKKTLKFPETVNIPDEAVHLIRALIASPVKRLTYEAVIRHPFFKTIDFTNLRQTTPPYLPPVGELDDVSNFSGGGSRTRDETIMDVSTNHTFSPVRMKESDPEQSPRHVEGDITLAVTLKSPEQANNENVDPNSTPPQPLSERAAKEKAIREAAAAPIHEEVEEMEDADWDGADCVRNLPFIGYSFTPGLVLLRKLTSVQGTTVINTTVINHAKSSPRLAVNQSASEVVPPLELLTELKQLHGALDTQLTSADPEYTEQTKIVQRSLANAIEDPGNISKSGEATQLLSTSILEHLRRLLDQRTNQIDRLLEENRQLQTTARENSSCRTVVDHMRWAVSGLNALPPDFVETDLIALTHAICPGYTPQSDNPGTSDTEDDAHVIQHLFSFVYKLLKQSMARESAHQAAMATASQELKEAWEASKQQMGTLQSIVADQRQLRECENRLNRQIQELQQKLSDSRQYQCELRNQCTIYESSIKDEKAKSEQLQTQLDSANKQVVRQKMDLEAFQRREADWKEQLAESERVLQSSKQELSAVRERLREAVADLEPSSRNRAVVNELKHELASEREKNETLLKQLLQLRNQADRLRDSNNNLVNQRDEVAQQVRELTAALTQEEELGKVTQQSYEDEIFRLTTITEQQGKLIKHMCQFLPPEHQPLRSTTGGGYCALMGASQSHMKKSAVKIFGHRAFKTTKTSDLSSLSRDPLTAAASAIFAKRRAAKGDDSEKGGDHHSVDRVFVKQPSRLHRMVKKSAFRLRRHRRQRPISETLDHSYSDQLFSENDLEDNTLAHISQEADNLSDDFNERLPGTRCPGRNDSLSTADSYSSQPSTTSSAPPCQESKASAWQRFKSKAHVKRINIHSEAQDATVPPSTKHRRRLLKQISKVLIKGKPLSSNSENTASNQN